MPFNSGGGAIHNFGDAKIQQLGSAVFRNQNVGRLDVAMNHQALVGVMDGGANLPEQRHPLPDTQVVALAVIADASAPNVLQHGVGLAAGGGSPLEPARNVGE